LDIPAQLSDIQHFRIPESAKPPRASWHCRAVISVTKAGPSYCLAGRRFCAAQQRRWDVLAGVAAKESDHSNRVYGKYFQLPRLDSVERSFYFFEELDLTPIYLKLWPEAATRLVVECGAVKGTDGRRIQLSMIG